MEAKTLAMELTICKETLDSAFTSIGDENSNTDALICISLAAAEVIGRLDTLISIVSEDFPKGLPKSLLKLTSVDDMMKEMEEPKGIGDFEVDE